MGEKHFYFIENLGYNKSYMIIKLIGIKNDLLKKLKKLRKFLKF